jgi:hypothetical protein
VLIREVSARQLRSIGPTRFLASTLTEAVLHRGVALPVLARLVNEMLLEISERPRELLIVDPYFFHDNDNPAYPDRVDAVWAGVVESVDRVDVIARQTPAALTAAIEAKARARNARVTFNVHRSNEFHDRFWIVDRQRGILVGTSVNGLGNKYAVADYLNEVDVRDIVRIVVGLGFLVGVAPAPRLSLHARVRRTLAEVARLIASRLDG